MRPEVSDITEELYGRLGPWARADGEDTGWALLHYCEAIAGRLLQPLEDIIRDQDGAPGWSQILDVDRAPEEWLPWLGQLVGVRMPDGLPAAQWRSRVKATDGFRRGSPEAIRAAARQHLIGPDGTGDSATVYLVERNGHPYRLAVVTLTPETPDPAKMQAAVKEQKPAGLTITFATVTGNTYAAIRDAFATYTLANADYATYTAMRDNPPTP